MATKLKPKSFQGMAIWGPLIRGWIGYFLLAQSPCERKGNKVQDWITDDLMDDLRAQKTSTELYADEFSACATCEQHPWLTFFFDGTGNNRENDRATHRQSNISRLYDAHAEKLPLMRKFYYSGVGTPLKASDPGWWESIRDSSALGGGAGLGWAVRLTRAVGDLDDALARNHKVRRIDIAVFGFSRGATLARAFVNRVLAKCTTKDGIPHLPCPTAVDGESAPIFFRFLGLFDAVESVGLPATNLSSMEVSVPAAVEKCLHLVSGHELRACFPLTPVRKSNGSHEEFVYPGVHSDVGGGYAPNEQARSDQLARIALNRMRREAAIYGVPFTPPSILKAKSPQIHGLFEYDAGLKALYDEYSAAVNANGRLEDQILAHMRLYYAWLKVRFEYDPAQIYEDIDALDEDSKEELERIQHLHAMTSNEADMLNWRAWITYLWNTDRDEYKRTISTAGGAGAPSSKPLTDEQLAYWNAWLTPPTLSENLIRFFDHYVHDSRAGFIAIDAGGYLRPRRIMDVPWSNTPAHDTAAATRAVAGAARSQEDAFSPRGFKVGALKQSHNNQLGV